MWADVGLFAPRLVGKGVQTWVRWYGEVRGQVRGLVGKDAYV